jgi:hypothetical protein
VATATGLAQTGTDATTDTLFSVLGTRCGAQAVKFHGLLSLNTHKVIHLVDHAANGGGVFQLNRVTDTAQAKAVNRGLVLAQNTDGATDLGNFNQSCHVELPRDRFD